MRVLPSSLTVARSVPTAARAVSGLRSLAAPFATDIEFQQRPEWTALQRAYGRWRVDTEEGPVAAADAVVAS